MQQTMMTAGCFCRKCGYDLRASAEAQRCPECGQVFSPYIPRTFRRRPPGAWKRPVMRWGMRAALVILPPLLLFGGLWGWLYRGYCAEAKALEGISTLHRNSLDYLVLGYEGKAAPDWMGRPSIALYRVRHVRLLPGTTDADMVPLQHFHRLQELALVNAKITDAGLACLRELKGLQRLNLWGTGITDAGMVHLRDLTELRFLRLSGTTVSDTGLGHLEGMTALRELYLDGTRVGGAGLRPLEKLTSLEVLHLAGTEVTDTSLWTLEKLPRLSHLDLNETRITPAGLARLKAARPDLHIGWIEYQVE